jgi:carbon starvation protein
MQGLLDSGKVVVASKVAEMQTLIFNNRLDAAVCGLFLILVTAILADSILLWIGILRGTRDGRVRETPFVPSQLRPEEV